MRDKNGVPSSIEDLSPEQDHNRPKGMDNESSLTAHLRALSAFVAQLRDKVAELEKKVS